MSQTRTTWNQKLILTLGHFFGVGLLPKAPGTWGTLAALPPFLALAFYAPAWSVPLAAMALFFIGIPVCSAYEKITGEKDPSSVVLDEVCGLFVAVAWLPVAPIPIILAILLFRVFDILKPFPIGHLDRKVGGGLGIMADDLMAGIFANVAVQLILHLIDGAPL